MSLLGPVFYYDLIRQSRRTFIPLVRIIYLAGLFCVLGYSGMNWSSRHADGMMPPGTVARFVETFFNSFLVVQFLLVVLLTPALTAGALTEEKENQTLPYLLASPLYRHEIVLGKLVSRLIALLLIVMSGLPVFALLQLLGGVDPGWLWAGFLATGATMFSLAAVSLYWSAVLPRSRDAVMFSYLTLPLYILLASLSRLVPGTDWATFPSTDTWAAPVTVADVVQWFGSGEPFWATGMALEGVRGRRGGAGVEEIASKYALFHLVIALMAILGAVLKLRHGFLAEEAKPRKDALPRRRFLFGGRPEIGDNPVLWREVYAERGTRWHWLARLVLILLVVLSFWPLLDILSLSGNHYYHFRESMNIWVRGVGTSVACLLLLAVAVRAAGTMTGEKQKQTLDVLLTTPLETDAIVYGKWLGSLASIGWGWLWLGAVTGLGLITGALNILALPLLCVCWGSYASFLAILGVRYSIRSATTLRATVMTILTAGAVWFGPWLLILCCGLLGSFNAGFEGLFKFMGGLTPPVALAFLAFGYDEVGVRGDRFLGEMVGYSLLGAIVWAVVAIMLAGVTRAEFRALVGRQRETGEGAHRRIAPRRPRQKDGPKSPDTLTLPERD